MTLNRRRVLAAKEAGVPSILAWVGGDTYENMKERAMRRNPAELLLLNPAASRPLSMGEVQQVMVDLAVPKPWRTRFMQGLEIEWREHGGGIDAHSVGSLVVDHLNEDQNYYRRARQNPPLTDGGYEQAIARHLADALRSPLAARIYHIAASSSEPGLSTQAIAEWAKALGDPAFASVENTPEFFMELARASRNLWGAKEERRIVTALTEGRNAVIAKSKRKNPAELLLLNPEERTVRQPSEVQSILIPKASFTKRQAQAWVAEHGFIDPGVDETDDYYRFRQMDPDRQHFKYRTIPFGDSGVQAVVRVSRLPQERENPGVRIPKGMRPVIEAYSEQIAKLASRVVHEVTGEPLTVQWTPRTEPLGAGSWGVVYPTRDPRFVVKVTADPTEGPIVSTIMSEPQLHNHMGIIHYFALRQLPEDITFRGKTFPVFVIVAERLKDVGALRGWSVSREDQHLTRLLMKIKDVAGKLVHEKQKKRPSQRLIDMLDEQYLDLVGQIHDGPISDFFFQFRDATDDGVLADVHLNNVGKRAVDWEAVTNGVVPLSGADWHWVISDPGHSSVETHPEIAPLRENPPLPPGLTSKFAFFDDSDYTPPALSETRQALRDAKRGDVVTVGRSQWVVMRVLGDIQLLAYKHPSKHTKLYEIRLERGDADADEVIVFEVGGSGQRKSEDVASGPMRLTGEKVPM